MNRTTCRITIVVNDLAGPGLTAEHGLAIWIEDGNANILFDTGQGEALLENVDVLGIDLSRTQFLVLSHGHYDHTGGIGFVLSRSPHAQVYFHPKAEQPRFSIGKGIPRPIHMPRRSIVSLGSVNPGHIHRETDHLLLTDSIGYSGEIPRHTSFEHIGSSFFLDERGRSPDLIEDDVSLWIKTSTGIVVCTGCCHAGLVNTLNHIRQISGESCVRAVIGGFHMISADEERLEKTVEELKGLAPEMVVPCHCTGNRAIEILTGGLGDIVCPGISGSVYEF